MNSLTLIFAAACLFAIAYRFYGLFLANRVMNLREERETPAVLYGDGHDYLPTNKYVLFGHHFAAIAAAGPLIGPVLAGFAVNRQNSCRQLWRPGTGAGNGAGRGGG